MITDTTSNAFKIVSKARTNKGIYFIDNMPCIACSKFYGSVGDELRITLSSGKTFHAIVVDTKKENELINHAHADGSLIEFIVDTKTLDKKYLQAGSLNGLYYGKIVKIERKNKND